MMFKFRYDIRWYGTWYGFWYEKYRPDYAKGICLPWCDLIKSVIGSDSHISISANSTNINVEGIIEITSTNNKRWIFVTADK